MYRLYKATVLLVCLLPAALAACEPDCSSASAGDYVADPLSCSSYYICMGGGVPSDHPVSCPPLHEFDPTTSSCEFPGGSTCTPCTLPDCHMTCSGDTTDLIRNPLDCSEYYSCYLGEVIDTYVCTEPEPYFDGVGCVDDETVCCSNLCRPYCHPGIVQAPDPLDCTSYYVCLATGLADEANHYQCPSNSYFDIPTGHCREGVPCVTLCSADESSTVSTTTADPNGCVEQFTCPGEGSFARCAVCDESYFECGAAGELGVLQYCLQGYFFNTNPDLPFCVVADACPFYP